MYEDRPRPSGAYVTANVLLILFVAAHPVAFLFIFGPGLGIYVIIPLVLSLCLYIGLVIHAAYRTEYRIANGMLEMKTGIMLREGLSLGEIRCAKRVEFMRRISGRGSRKGEYCTRGFCNRFKNGVCMSTTNGDVFVSPTDIERFIAELGTTGGRS